MTQRLDYQSAAPGGFAAMLGLEQYVRGCGLPHSLLELVKVRASQLNGCAFCLDMHVQDARAAGETEQRLHLVAAWREAHCFTPRERAALAWAEAVTLLKDKEVDDAVYQEARTHFDEKALVDLTWAVAAINSWNRLNVAFRTPSGRYKPVGP